eukprot:TRINITY_DN69128_c0_g1_i1.p4 TRINITY_DN69128_c0_g1~~TRINITY_DN69128_c0_g1_i1.p4  ORF type:complete len:104 (-),score=3.70 TRINITY_DN69128_c0_g1_i1:51-362(-)
MKQRKDQNEKQKRRMRESIEKRKARTPRKGQARVRYTGKKDRQGPPRAMHTETARRKQGVVIKEGTMPTRLRQRDRKEGSLEAVWKKKKVVRKNDAGQTFRRE